MKIKSLFNPHLIITAFLLVFIGLLSTGSYPKKISPGQGLKLEDIKRENKTRNFEITRLEMTPAYGDLMAQLTFTNSYDKVITSFTIKIGDGKVTEELIYNEQYYILPGGSYTSLFAIGDAINGGIPIIGVVFEDGTGEGDGDVIRDRTEMRSGVASVYNHSLPKIKQMRNSVDARKQESIESLKAYINAFPEELDRPGDIRPGVRYGKQQLLSKINESEFNPSINLADALSRLETHCQETSRKLWRYTPGPRNQRL